MSLWEQLSGVDAPALDLDDDEVVIEAVVFVRTQRLGVANPCYYHRFSTGVTTPEAIGIVRIAERLLIDSGASGFQPLEGS